MTARRERVSVACSRRALDFTHLVLNARPARNTLERVAGHDTTWGGSVHLKLGFKDRSRLLPGVRHLVSDVCGEYLESRDTTQQLVTAVQELLENLVKYSEAGASALDFELSMIQGEPTARIETSNRASGTHLREASEMLERIISAPDPDELFQSLIESSGDRKGSGLGLVRLRAEAGFTLSYAAEKGRLRIEARRGVQPRRSKT